MGMLLHRHLEERKAEVKPAEAPKPEKAVEVVEQPIKKQPTKKK